VELDVSMRTYLPDGRLMELGPDFSSLPGLFLAGNVIDKCPVGVAINVPNLSAGKKYENERIHLDGNTFVNCRFKNCVMVFTGSAHTGLKSNGFDGCDFVFEGPALVTLQHLHKLYHGGPGFKELVEKWLIAIRSADDIRR